MLADGPSLVLLEPRSARSVTVTAVREFDAGSATVAALNPSNQPGLIGTATLKAPKPTCAHPKAVRGKLVCDGVRPHRSLVLAYECAPATSHTCVSVRASVLVLERVEHAGTGHRDADWREAMVDLNRVRVCGEHLV